MTETTSNGCARSAFTSDLRTEALQSAAVNHRYLQALREGDFPDLDFAMKDFAFQYGLYSAKFTRYVAALMNNLVDARHRIILENNLAEEQGNAHDAALPPEVLASISGQPHTLLYRRFQQAVGVDAEKLASTPDCPGLQWSQQFLALCATNECVGVGAIGIGTEYIVTHIYNQILDGLKKHSELSMAQRVFFDLHSECDEQHAAEMLNITEDLAVDDKAREDIANGVRTAIKLRSVFWDSMLERAMTGPDRNPADEGPAVGHQKSL